MKVLLLLLWKMKKKFEITTEISNNFTEKDFLVYKFLIISL